MSENTMNDDDPDLYLVAAKPRKKAINVAIDARVFEAFEHWVDQTGAAKGAVVGLAVQRFLESKGVRIRGIHPSANSTDPGHPEGLSGAE
ncbi:MAG: hypothetical protein O2892_07825 [Actinomycetota bacterium]|jgi:hypothetical protein|nr:hypothetical protein [Actinomycetota bacterium]MDA2948937.1 hypothetical protein [Actinomycetota bacterium]